MREGIPTAKYTAHVKRFTYSNNDVTANDIETLEIYADLKLDAAMKNRILHLEYTKAADINPANYYDYEAGSAHSHVMKLYDVFKASNSETPTDEDDRWKPEPCFGGILELVRSQYKCLVHYKKDVEEDFMIVFHKNTVIEGETDNALTSSIVFYPVTKRNKEKAGGEASQEEWPDIPNAPDEKFILEALNPSPSEKLAANSPQAPDEDSEDVDISSV